MPVIAYTLDTRRARSEVRGQRAQSLLINELVATASNDHNTDEQIGRTLFSLLIPIELEAYLAGSGEMQIELDPQTAGDPVGTARYQARGGQRFAVGASQSTCCASCGFRSSASE